MIDALNDLVADGLPKRMPECTVVLVVPDEQTFLREVAPFYASLQQAIGLRLGATSPNLSHTWGTNPAAGVLNPVIESLRTVRGNAPVLILGAQSARPEQGTEQAAVAILLGEAPTQPVYVEVAGFSTLEAQPFERLLEPALQHALSASGTTMGDIGHVVLTERDGTLSRAQLHTAARSQSATGVWAGSLWSSADVFGNTGAMSGFVDFLIAYDITVRGWPNMQGMWVSDDGDGPQAIVLRRKGPVLR